MDKFLKIIILFLLLIFGSISPSYANKFYSETEVDVGLVWGFWGDSMVVGSATGTTKGIPEATRSVWTSTIPIPDPPYKSGVSGCSLTESAARYAGYANKANLTWVHFSEYGRTRYSHYFHICFILLPLVVLLYIKL